MLPFYNKKNDDGTMGDDMEHGGGSGGSGGRRRRPFYVSIYSIIVGSIKGLIKKLQRKRINFIYVFIGVLIFISLSIVLASSFSSANLAEDPNTAPLQNARQSYRQKLIEQRNRKGKEIIPIPYDEVFKKGDPVDKKDDDDDDDGITTTVPPVITDDDDDDDDDDKDTKINGHGATKDPNPKRTGGLPKQATATATAAVSDKETERRRAAVKAAMKFAWDGYVSHAWGSDELKPASKRPHTWLGMGASITDALDTLWIMGFKTEFYRARDWVRDHFDPTPNSALSFFETTIRSLGGLLSAYGLSGDRAFLDKAVPLADGLLRAINSESGIPYAFINPKTGAHTNPGWTGGKSILAEIGTVQLEFAYLSHVTGNPDYRAKAFRILDVLFAQNPGKGILPAFVDTRTGKATSGARTLGALADSYYEYLLKLWLFLGGKAGGSAEAAKFREMYDMYMDAAIDDLTFTSKPSGLVYITDRSDGRVSHKFEHLTCFAGGMLALGAVAQNTSEAPNHDSARQFATGAGVTRTCYEIYARAATKLSPETVQFVEGKDFSTKVPYNILRPEAVESFFVLWRITHDPIYREYGWKVFQAFEEVSKSAVGYSGIKDVNAGAPALDDIQPSWFLAETLKYLYLLFSPDDVIPLDEYVFNTEAHPLPIIGNN